MHFVHRMFLHKTNNDRKQELQVTANHCNHLHVRYVSSGMLIIDVKRLKFSKIKIKNIDTHSQSEF